MRDITSHKPTTGYAIGDNVKASKDIWEDPSGDSPGGIQAYRGDLLEVRKVGHSENPWLCWPVYVAHPNRKPDEMFGVKEDEIARA